MITPVQASSSCACGSSQPKETSSEINGIDGCDCGKKVTQEKDQPVTINRFLEEVFNLGKQLLVMFAGFAFIGFFLNGLIPEGWITTLFGSGNSFSVPLAATLGLPFYISSEGSLPLISSLIRRWYEPGCGNGLPDHRCRYFPGSCHRCLDHRQMAGNRPGGWYLMDWRDIGRIYLQPHTASSVSIIAHICYLTVERLFWYSISIRFYIGGLYYAKKDCWAQ